METIQELIQNHFNRAIICGGWPDWHIGSRNEDNDTESRYDKGRIQGHKEADDYTKELLKSLIDAVIEDIDEMSYYKGHINDEDFTGSDGEVGYDKAKQDTISKLKAIRELL